MIPSILVAADGKVKKNQKERCTCLLAYFAPIASDYNGNPVYGDVAFYFWF